MIELDNNFQSWNMDACRGREGVLQNIILVFVVWGLLRGKNRMDIVFLVSWEWERWRVAAGCSFLGSLGRERQRMWRKYIFFQALWDEEEVKTVVSVHTLEFICELWKLNSSEKIESLKTHLLGLFLVRDHIWKWYPKVGVADVYFCTYQIRII